ncbi:hypothetical protein COHA_000563 [Chlorella ohadii]|uniref:Zeaxanthin epoxidase, chloroplastic n=1 Tax=Chlorella ohadii TaxID=2649997 RepID=A0AAD5DZM6_9CHLO|nr:hypothetical protein COHA_000563 [Chlorella ohadii]
MLGSACAQRAAAPAACSTVRAPQQQQAAALAFRRAVGGGGAALRSAAAGSSTAAPPCRGAACTQAVAAPERPTQQPSAGGSEQPPLKVIIAGGGIGGLVLAVGLLKRGFDVTVLERDMTAIRGEGKYRGPIQIQSNALAALEALDTHVAQRVYEEGCITGDRINGLCDGVTGDWYIKFDTFHPAVDMGLPVTRVISRITLQEILADACRALAGDSIILNSVNVVDYEQGVDPKTGRKIVTAIAQDGRRFTGNLLVGADGIWSKIRDKMIGPTKANYSEYTCYTGISDFTPADIDVVGYRVFLGNGRYFVSSDVGGGKMQWYGFNKEPANGTDPPGKRKERLMEIFGDWSHHVTDLLKATPEEEILRRDIYERAPMFKWADGRVVLLGDSAHAMQPNLGQGGCMAIEDAYQLVLDLCHEADKAAEKGPGAELDVERVLNGYMRKRVVRAASIHGMAGMAAYMASTYKAYLGEGLGPLEWLTKFKIPHPGRVIGQIIMKATMPGTMGRVLGGFRRTLDQTDRLPMCHLADQPQGFPHDLFPVYMEDDDALLRASHAAWVLEPVTAGANRELHLEFEATKGQSPVISRQGMTVGRAAACDLRLDAPSASDRHARLHQCEAGDYHITDLGSQQGTYVNGKRLVPNTPHRLLPSDELCFGSNDLGGKRFKVKMMHRSLLEGGRHGSYERPRSVPPPSDATMGQPQLGAAQ